MNKAEKYNIIIWANSLSDEELEKEYYKAVFDSLGSQVDDMYNLGYDIVDIREQVKLEKLLRDKSSLLAYLCIKRGIELWKDKVL